MIYTFTANPSLDKLYVLNKLSIGQYNRGQVVQYDTGGKGINVSRCLKELGEKSTIVGYFGGSTGDSLIEKLTSQGYEVDPIHIEGESRSNITLIENIDGQMTKLNEFGPASNLKALDSIIEKIEKRTKKGDIWILSGSVLPGLPIGFYAVLINKIQACGGLAFLDSSGMWLIYGYQAIPFVVRINRNEAETVVGKKIESKEEIISTLRMFQNKGLGISIISLDAEGAMFADKNAILDVSAPSVAAKTVVGAGDAMMAMIVHGHLHNWPLEKIAQWSVAAGCASVMKEGTSIAEFELIQALVGEVDLRVID
jgi:1-phosphofructokinase family hexose kinase